VVSGLLGAGHTLNGMDLLITSNLPRGAGLSSSAALEVATAHTFSVANELHIAGKDVAPTVEDQGGMIPV
jgi:galactokinase